MKGVNGFKIIKWNQIHFSISLFQYLLIS
jgi:hypothetical protein